MEVLLEKNKIYSDVIYNSIETTFLANLIIDNEIYQRLRYLGQLGVCSLVFPNANNKRFEHSLGVYHLAGRLIEYLIRNSEIEKINNELIKIPFMQTYLHHKHGMEKAGLKFFAAYKNETLFDNYLIELIKIAGLVHDLGHGPFSHLFDSWLKSDERFTDCKYLEHEARSKALLREILNTRKVEINGEEKLLNEFIGDEAYNFICELIEPNENTPDNFIFQIISNAKNGFDVDKLDYILRDSYYLNESNPYNLESIISQCKVTDRKMCFPKKVSYEVYKVYRSRYDLHKKYYGHKTVIAIEFIIMEILKNIDKIIGIKEDILKSSLEKFKDLSDNTILFFTKNFKLMGFENSDSEHYLCITKINSLLDDLNFRNLPKCIYIESRPKVSIDNNTLEQEVDDLKTENTVTSSKPVTEAMKNAKLIKQYADKNGIPKSKVVVVRRTIGFVSSEKSHPLDDIYFLNEKGKAFIMEKESVSMCVPFAHVEEVLIIYKMTDNLCLK